MTQGWLGVFARLSRAYVFADESGNFDFRRANGASRYFVLGTVTMSHSDTAVGNKLLELRRELAWNGVGLDSVFHATEDSQLVRDKVFEVIAECDLRADFTIFEKSKLNPSLHDQAKFYKFAWHYHFKHVCPRITHVGDDLLVVASSLGAKKKRSTFRRSIEEVVENVTPTRRWQVAFWGCESDPCLQVADYCTWAVQRKYESLDDRSYILIKDKVATEFDIFGKASRHFY